MGTLFNQPERRLLNDDFVDEIRFIKRIAEQEGLPYESVVETIKALELRRKNNLYLDNGDIHDEQMMGLGELIQQFNEHFANAFGVETDSPGYLEALADRLRLPADGPFIWRSKRN